ncbi:alpha-1,3-arabinosyltransferase XAT3-like isoform X2 [Salvia splendens]|uniref:alpha-1,3-arabinosyltransferase XAT3-like isoform X2 n=1 Tax=Salvia splendens TaxID=180675 RepID=UPI001C2803E4|nr:alpha-1,3-arabinosyltransferase XAT3-like isoform X2 [Salvia splendens]
MKLEKDEKKQVFGVTPFLLLLSLPFLCVGADFLWGNRITFHQWMQNFTGVEAATKKVDDKKFINFHLARLVRGEDRRELDDTGFACHRAFHSVHCVSTKPVRIDTRNMTVYVPSDNEWENETVVRPYPWQGYAVNEISHVRIIQYSNATAPPPCDFRHRVPAVVFSSGYIGNTYHEMSEIIIPLYITTRHFQSRVAFVVEDYKPSFFAKYNAIITRLTAHEVINPAANAAAVHCFPASVVGLKYHGILKVNSTDIPGGYGMPEFKRFLREIFSLTYSHVSEIPRPRLLLLSRTKSRKFLNEDEMIAMMQEVGFEVVVVRGSNLATMARLVNSCSVIVGVHGAGLTNDVFMAKGGVVVQVEPLGTEWISKVMFGDTARAMGLHHLLYKIEEEESSLVKLYGRNSSVVIDPASVYRGGGYMTARAVFIDQQNVKINLARFRSSIVEALSIVTD